jgi:hypothetical protein
MRSGTTVDVKTTKYKTGKLIERKSTKSKADVYVLVTGEFPVYELVGWVYSVDLFKAENLTDLGHGETYAISQNKLNLF